MTTTILNPEDKAMKMTRALIRARDSYWVELSSDCKIGVNGTLHCKRVIATMNEALDLPPSSLSRLFDAIKAEV